MAQFSDDDIAQMANDMMTIILLGLDQNYSNETFEKYNAHARENQLRTIRMQLGFVGRGHTYLSIREGMTQRVNNALAFHDK